MSPAQVLRLRAAGHAGCAADHREAGGGAVIAAHDLDTFLPHADRVLLLRLGRVAADLTPHQAHNQPKALMQAGIGLPPSMRLAEQLRGAGINFISTAMTPEDMAEAVISSQSLRRGTDVCSRRSGGC